MKNLVPILLAVVVLSSGCDPDGYSCNSDGCYEDTDNPQYQTLEDCNSMCDEQIQGDCGTVLHEGYEYSTVQIGNQCWFAENCRYLPFVSTGELEASDTSPRYYVYDYQGADVEAAKSTENYETYGVLYSWPAVMAEGVCPSGWHIPSDGEFTELTDFLGGESFAGYVMKSTSGWNDNIVGGSGTGSNSSGWTGLPGGYRNSVGYNFDGTTGTWWSASESGSWSGILELINSGDYAPVDISPRDYAYSARCVQD